MAEGPETLLRYIRRFIRPEPGECTDASLLGRFIAEKDERAFAALVERHGPLVLQVCWRVLGNVEDAEDAFQAAFLVLARKAATVHPREALPAWLYGVARRIALKARSARVRQLQQARSMAAPAPDRWLDPLSELSARELLAILDEEVQRLPGMYRLPVVLCCLQGRSLEEAARQLGWTSGSVKGRLERGRTRLHDRLVRRGLTLTAALAAAEVSRGAMPAALVARLVAPTVSGAMAFASCPTTAASGISAGAAALASETLRGMALAKLKIAAALLLPTCLLATGFVMHRAAQSPSTAAPQIRSSPLPPKDKSALAALANKRPAAPADEADAQIEVSGRVRGPDDKPFVGARLYVGYSDRRYLRRSASDIQFRQTAYPLRATSGTDGSFHFAFAKSELDPRQLDDSKPAVIALADGHGPDWAEIPAGAWSPDRATAEGAHLSLKLVEDLPLDGRILDQDRRPVAGAKVLVRDVMKDSEAGVTGFLRGDSSYWSPRSWRGPLPGQPVSITTDVDGRFRLTGLGRDRIVRVALEEPAIQHTVFEAVTRAATATPDVGWIRGATFDYITRPSRSIRGVMRDKATGKPLAGVKMMVQQTNATTLTDQDGRFEMLGCPRLQDGYLVMAQPQTGQPYFAASAWVAEQAGPDPLTVNFDLVGGILLSGRVTDQATRKPPRTAVVEYFPLFPNSHSSKITNGIMAASSALTRPDGSYSLVVLPGPGVVCVAASPRDLYAVAMVDDSALANFGTDARNGSECRILQTAVGIRGRGALDENKYHTLSLINPDDRAELVALDLTLQPAGMLKGTVVAPDGKPLTGVKVIGLTALPEEEVLEGASFNVMGLNPRRGRTLFFHHRDRAVGKVLTIRGDTAGPLTVQLDPCGSVLGRIVGKDGKPVPEVTIRLMPSYANASFVTAKSDRDGRFRAALAPGQKYRLQLLSSRRLLRDVAGVEVELGRSKDLGDLRLAD